MSALLQRARALEDKFAHEQEFMFKVQARRNNLVGLWAAAIMHTDNAKAYAEELTHAAVTDPTGVADRLRRDFDAAGVVMLDDEIQSHMASVLKAVAQDMYEGR